MADLREKSIPEEVEQERAVLTGADARLGLVSFDNWRLWLHWPQDKFKGLVMEGEYIVSFHYSGEDEQFNVTHLVRAADDPLLVTQLSQLINNPIVMRHLAVTRDPEKRRTLEPGRIIDTATGEGT